LEGFALSTASNASGSNESVFSWSRQHDAVVRQHRVKRGLETGARDTEF
jgi:hypothetical protein